MKTAARVLAVTDKRARLGCDSIAQACGACRGGCLLRRLARGGDSSLEVSRLDSDGVSLEPGERVTVQVDGADLIGAALRAALLPLAGVLAGPLLLWAFAAEPAASDGAEVLAATVGLLAGWAVARLWLRRVPPAVVVSRDPRSLPDSDGGAGP